MADPIPFTDPEPQFGPEPPFVREARLRRAAGMDKSVAEAQRDALAAALANLLGQAGGMASYLPVGEKNRGALRDFAKLSSQRMGETSEALSEAATNEDLGILGEAAVRYPVNTVAYLPELLNPVGKVQAWKPVSKVAQYAPEVANAAWHAARGYAQGGAPQAGVSAGANIVGETVMEPFVAAPWRPRGVPLNLAGNAAGAPLESIVNFLLQPKD
jgi:hypothetical protein